MPKQKVEELTPEQPKNFEESPAKAPWRKNLIIGGVLLLLFALLYGVVLSSFENEVSAHTVRYTPGKKVADYVEIEATILTIDPFHDSTTMRLEFQPKGNFLSEKGVTAKKDLKLYVNSVNGTSEHSFAKGKRMGAFELALELHDGDVANYPLDKYGIELELDLFEVGADKVETPAPIVVNFTGDIHGMKVESSLAPESTDGNVLVKANVGRSGSTIFFAVITMAILIFLTVVMVFVVGMIATDKSRKVEFDIFVWGGALLFAFPAIRDTMPGSPPIGSLTDFLVFFWVEGILVIAMVVTAILWFKRPTE